MTAATRLCSLVLAIGLVGFLGAPAQASGLESAPDPEVRQGGESTATAIGIWSLPFFDGGTTAGYVDDYDYACPDSSDSPDVVYSYELPMNKAGLVQFITVDLCGAEYDTKVYIATEYQGELDVLACNDDYPCNGNRAAQSRIQKFPIYPYETYYIIIDGSSGESGEYNLVVNESTGACCLPDGSCFVAYEDDCVDGEWLGELTDCDPNPCVAVGACCFRNASCRILDQGRCELLRGTYMGDDTVCHPDPCGVPPARGGVLDEDNGQPQEEGSSWGRIKSRHR